MTCEILLVLVVSGTVMSRISLFIKCHVLQKTRTCHVSFVNTSWILLKLSSEQYGNSYRLHNFW